MLQSTAPEWLLEVTVAEPAKPRRARKVTAPPAATEPAPAPAATATRKAAAPKAPVQPRRPLEQGDRGDTVRAVQERLQTLGYDPGKINGLFGYATVRAVRSMQGAIGTRPSGVIDAATWAALWK